MRHISDAVYQLINSMSWNVAFDMCWLLFINAKVYIFILSSCLHKAQFQTDGKGAPNMKQLILVLSVSTF